jgi:hypothetical protein
VADAGQDGAGETLSLDHLWLAVMWTASMTLFKMLFGAIGVAVCALVVVVALTKDFSGSGSSPTPLITLDSLPADQQDFVRAVNTGRNAYQSGANDMAKGAARAERKRLIDRALRAYTISGWIGRVQTLSSNGDGNGVLALRVGPDMYVKTWSNALSDISDRTLLDPSSNVFRVASKMKSGDIVRFSGEFFRNEVDTVRESSVSISGSMTKPEFIFRFSTIEAAPDFIERSAANRIK